MKYIKSNLQPFLTGILITIFVLSLLKIIKNQSADAQLVPNTATPAPVSTEVDTTSGIANTQTVNSSSALFRERYNELLPEERVSALIYEHHNKSVVNIETVFIRQARFMMQEEAEGRGSGIVLNQQGLILTNFHVVEKADTISVTLYNGETYRAKKIGEDPNTDIAILKISAPTESLVPIQFGDSSKLLVGQLVYAIGNPFGHDRTMTRGIVSNLNRTISSPNRFRQIKGVIQIDAAINPGNSGGPLFDSLGRMIGMNTAIASRIGENTGVGFAIPANTIQRISTILVQSGKVVRGDIGIVQVTETEYGLLPVLIDNDGAADRAGLQGRKLVLARFSQNGNDYITEKVINPEKGFDIIIGVNGNPTKTGEEFITAVEEHKPGETIQLDIIRNRKKTSISVVLDSPSEKNH